MSGENKGKPLHSQQRNVNNELPEEWNKDEANDS